MVNQRIITSTPLDSGSLQAWKGIQRHIIYQLNPIFFCNYCKVNNKILKYFKNAFINVKMLNKTLFYLSLVIIPTFITNGITAGLFTNAFAQSTAESNAEQKQQQGQANQTSSVLKGQSGLQGSFFSIDNITFSHHMASVNGIQMHYVIGGHGDPVVLLHGWPETWYAWHNIMPALAKNYTVIAPDLRGLGDSSKPPTGYDGKTAAEDIHQLVISAGI